MPQWLVQVIVALIPLVLGGSLYAAFIRPRVYYEMREYFTIRAFGPNQRDRVESMLLREGIPTAFAEVEWWNAGRRAATGVVIEVIVPGEVLTHELNPAADDLVAGWRLVQEPTDLGGGRFGLRVAQDRLMPGGRTNMTVGYVTGSDESAVTNAFLHDRRVPLAAPVRARHSSAVGWLGLPGYGLVVYAASRIPFVRIVGNDNGVGSALLLVALIAGFFVFIVLINMALFPFDPGRASWSLKRKAPKP